MSYTALMPMFTSLLGSAAGQQGVGGIGGGSEGTPGSGSGREELEAAMKMEQANIMGQLQEGPQSGDFLAGQQASFDSGGLLPDKGFQGGFQGLPAGPPDSVGGGGFNQNLLQPISAQGAAPQQQQQPVSEQPTASEGFSPFSNMFTGSLQNPNGLLRMSEGYNRGGFLGALGMLGTDMSKGQNQNADLERQRQQKQPWGQALQQMGGTY